MFLFVELKVLKSNIESSATHFNKIALQYKDQFSDHIWDHLLKRKMKLITEVLPKPLKADIGLDLGCGIGDQCLELSKYGYSLIGVDNASNLVHQAQIAGVTALVENAQALLFMDSCFGFIYTVGVLHHLADEKERREVFHEIKRVLKPGGLFIVHETNPRNPIFRFYMGYIFPILKNIDEGTERWIDPTLWTEMNGMKLVHLRYFTFMPDFIPRWLMGLAVALERRLEASALRSYSVHYMAVLQKDPT